jgi:hypothetical protein
MSCDDLGKTTATYDSQRRIWADKSLDEQLTSFVGHIALSAIPQQHQPQKYGNSSSNNHDDTNNKDNNDNNSLALDRETLDVYTRAAVASILNRRSGDLTRLMNEGSFSSTEGGEGDSLRSTQESAWKATDSASASLPPSESGNEGSSLKTNSSRGSGSGIVCAARGPLLELAMHKLEGFLGLALDEQLAVTGLVRYVTLRYVTLIVSFHNIFLLFFFCFVLWFFFIGSSLMIPSVESFSSTLTNQSVVCV